MCFSLREVCDLIYDPAKPDICKVDLYLPEGVENPPLFLYFHGGGLEAGSRKDVPAKDLAIRHGIAVASADYRMYPTAHFPDYLVDAANCVKYLVDMNAFSKIFVGGSSAGGYISMMLCFAPEYLGTVGMKPADIAGYVHDAGQPTVHFNVLRERGMDTRIIRVDEACPIYFADRTPEAGSVPNMLFLYADGDMPCRPEQTEMFVATLKYLNYPMEKIRVQRLNGFCHCGYLGHFAPDGENLFSKTIWPFIESCI